jgi:hypothetical protein
MRENERAGTSVPDINPDRISRAYVEEPKFLGGGCFLIPHGYIERGEKYEY